MLSKLIAAGRPLLADGATGTAIGTPDDVAAFKAAKN